MESFSTRSCSDGGCRFFIPLCVAFDRPYISIIRRDTRRNSHQYCSNMKSSTFGLASLFVYGIAQPHQRYHKKQDIALTQLTTTLPVYQPPQLINLPQLRVYSLSMSAFGPCLHLCYAAFRYCSYSSLLPPTTTAAPVQVVTAPSSLASASASPSSGTCTAKSPCTRDLTYCIAGLGACNVTSDGNSEVVVATLFGFMGNM
jgi:hypothetical protein